MTFDRSFESTRPGRSGDGARPRHDDAPDDGADESDPEDLEASEGNEPDLRPPLVYIVDDDPDVCASLQDLLDAEDIVARTFVTARDFLAAYDPEQPGCILLDVRMRGMSGLDLLERLRGDGLMMPVIMMSAHDDTPSTVRAMKGGAMTFLKKPIEGQVLFDHVNEALDLDVVRRREERRDRDVKQRYVQLTDREAEVLDMVVRGFSSKEIGERLPETITHKTVEAHRASIMRKMQAKNVAHLIYLAHILKLDVLRQMTQDDFS